MEDGPEAAEGQYSYAGKTYRLEEQESERWRVYDGDTYLGTLAQTDATSNERWMHYSSTPAGDEGASMPTTDDWHAALRHLIDLADE
ncbi:hypothetical protein ACR8AL_07485 [Clavibacter sepedonicus]|uniref:Uncharacterized protein n=1 Tax=Clavibacter sepedonicus TaxID=31964 RepID=B0RJF8_CLASE|nr:MULTISPECIES: hypothetical protein [Clavibacter]MBD5382463.1 hypothetical protein [Clavibacter sp.]OQJ45289.1 hypothetical protein B5P19_15630 [Clavibacter sepedonicus]OQJ50976.1 hypothetical protein B5P20_16265 [Clavibacter sepedonicus]UUK67215.1 hypothetical protein LRE50_15770 [Clavibacter sepedonicus]CAQ03348.1 hypothetical protein pCSL0105 [Clavibacter sepedonicus]